MIVSHSVYIPFNNLLIRHLSLNSDEEPNKIVVKILRYKSSSNLDIVNFFVGTFRATASFGTSIFSFSITSFSFTAVFSFDSFISATGVVSLLW